MTYAEQLDHPLWKMRKNRVLAANNCCCQHCGRQDAQMQVHHVHYKKGRMAWEYPEEMLMCLCEWCHKRWHEEHGKAQNALAMALKRIPGPRIPKVASRLMIEAMEEI